MRRLCLVALFSLLGCKAVSEGTPIPCEGVVTSDWFAWNDVMPPPPNDFHVTGNVEVGNPGVVAALSERSDHDGRITLDLELRQKSGQWAQMMTAVEVRFDKDLEGTDRISVASVVCGDTELATLEVGDAH
jgi:hypothetical protein